VVLTPGAHAQAQKDRDAAALGSGVMTVIDEVLTNACLQVCLPLASSASAGWRG